MTHFDKGFKTEFSDNDFGIAETDKDIEDFHDKFWGCGNVKMKREVLQALLDGKAILFEDGEYSHAILLETIEEYKARGEKTC